MNEFFVAEPNCCESIGDLRFLLSRFGTYAGRYLVDYPGSWRSQLSEQFQSPMQAKKLEEILIDAQKNTARLSIPELSYSPQQPWVENALGLKRGQPQKIDEIITSPSATKPGTVSFDDLINHPLTAGEPMHAQPSGYVRVCRTLMAVSQELHFIDPFLNPCKNDYRVVIEEMLKRLVATRKLREVVFWARASEVIDEANSKNPFSWEEVRSEWKSLLEGVQWPDDWSFEYKLVDDLKSVKKMHDRFLLSVKGAVQLGQGFQRLGKDKTVYASPVNKTIHDDLLRTYLEEKDNFTIFRCFQHNQR